MKFDYNHKTILITGASSGIGEEFARELSAVAKKLILVARRKERLIALKEELLGINRELLIDLYFVDLTNLEQLKNLVLVIKSKDEIDLLINNAGRGLVGPYDKNNWDIIHNMIQLNVTSLSYLTHAFLPEMIKKNSGGILNVSSGFGFTYLPGFAAYIGSKHFVTGLTKTIDCEIAGTNVLVSQLCPGPVATEFGEHIGNTQGAIVPSFLEIQPRKLVKITLKKFSHGKHLIIPEYHLRLTVFLLNFIPEFIIRFINRKLGQKIRKSY